MGEIKNGLRKNNIIIIAVLELFSFLLKTKLETPFAFSLFSMPSGSRYLIKCE